MNLHKDAMATLPVDPAFRGYVEGSQYDQYGKSGWEQFIGQSKWCTDSDTLLLEHTPEDHLWGLRGFLVDIMDTLRCHQDFQFCDGSAFLQNYLVKYVSKFSDSMTDDILNDDADASSIACNMCMRYRPTEPEMLLQLMGQRFRQWALSTKNGGKRNFLPPTPDTADQCGEVGAYIAADWAVGKISLIDFLRKTTGNGKICHWLTKLHKEHVLASSVDTTLEEFARAYRMQGSVCRIFRFISIVYV